MANITEILKNRATTCKRFKPAIQRRTYAGRVLRIMRSAPGAKLVDVRTRAESTGWGAFRVQWNRMVNLSGDAAES